MSTEKLLKVAVSGPLAKLDEAIRSLILDGEFHPLEASELLVQRSKLSVPESNDPYRAALDAAVALLTKLKLEPQFVEFRDKGYTLEDCSEYIREASAACTRIIAHRNSELSLAADDQDFVNLLQPYAELTVNISALTGVRRLDMGFAKVDGEAWPALRRDAGKEDGMILHRTGADLEDQVFFAWLALPRVSDKLTDILIDYDVELTAIPRGADGEVAPAELLPKLNAEINAAGERAAKLSEELEGLIAGLRDELLSRYCWLRYMSEGYALRSKTAVDSRRFHLLGWVPVASRAEIEEKCVQLEGECIFEKPTRADVSHVPVKFRSGFFTRIFAPFVEMYGFPMYGEFDPRIFMTVSYMLLFGMMFGDVGQGAVLVLLGLYIAVKKKMWLGRILAAVGCSAIGFGFVYGSVFGNEHILPGFKVLEGNGVVSILLMTAGVGVVMIIFCGVLNIITGFRQNDLKKAIFSANGIVGVTFLVGLFAGVVGDLVLGKNIMSNDAYWTVLVILLLCIWLGDLLTWLCSGRKGHGQGVGMMILEGFFDLFEAFLSWLSNCLSFLRVGTYAICHAIMMLIVYTLSSNAAGGYSIIGLVAGNIIVMVIEAVLVCIQVLRLEFYELFGRFYSGRGTPFEPVEVNYAVTATVNV